MIDTALGPISVGIVAFIALLVGRSLYQSYQDGKRRKLEQALTDRVMRSSQPTSPTASSSSTHESTDGS
jgi:hypothetical protein